jgi:uncharacterized protein
MNPVFHFYNAVADDVCKRLLTEIPAQYKYHSLRHTLDVVEQCNRIAQSEGLDEFAIQIVRIAALFHDTGYMFNRKNHEELSCTYFKELASKHALPKLDQELIVGCIMATRISQSPKNALERVLCDADLDYLGRPDFEEIGEMLFEELKACGEIGDRLAWNTLQIQFLSNYQFHTEYGRTNRQSQLNVHLEKLKASQI